MTEEQASKSGIETLLRAEPHAGSAARPDNRTRAHWAFFASRRSPLLPEDAAGGGSLTAVLGAISSLAALALAAFLMIAAATGEWTGALDATLTVQVRGTEATEISQRAEAALAVLEADPAVLSATLMPAEEAARLLEPWLGKGAAEYLNVPALIDIEIAPEARLRLQELSERIEGSAPGVTIDNHDRWNRRLVATARSGQALAFAVVLLVMAAACAISVFAARAGLSANAEVIALLHLVGATDQFIAREVQGRFLIIGLRGGTIGVAVALLAIGALTVLTRGAGADAFFAPDLSLSPMLAAPLLVVPLAMCLTTGMAARLTVLRALKVEY